MRLPDGFRPDLVAIDLDDTLIPHDETVHEVVIDAIRRVRDLGVTVVAATGRSISTTLPIARIAGMSDWAVCSNGALLARVGSGEIVETITFDPTELLTRLEAAVPNGQYGVEDAEGMFRTNRMFRHDALTVGVREVTFAELMHEPVIRLVLRSDEHLDGGLGHLAEQLGMHSVVFGVGDVAWMDIGPHGVNKATMLQRLCDRLGLHEPVTMAVGDSMNDIAMLQWATVGVLMGHADDRMRPYADVVTGAQPGYGVAEALNAIG